MAREGLAPGALAKADPRWQRPDSQMSRWTRCTSPYGSGPIPTTRCFVLGLMGWMLDGLDDTGRKRALGALSAAVTAHAGSDGVTFASGAWLIRAVRP